MVLAQPLSSQPPPLLASNWFQLLLSPCLKAHFEVLTGQNWNIWARTLGAILHLNEIEAILQYDTAPSPVGADNWTLIQKKALAYLCLYCAADVYSIVESDINFPTFKDKYNRLCDTYGGIGSMAVFNLCVELTHTRLDDGSPLTSQLAKLNETRIKFTNTEMGVSDTQYSLILLNAIPKSYEVVATTLLASGPPSVLKHNEITAHLINKEGRKSGPSSSLNTAAPVKSRKKKKKDYSNVTCHYCNKKGHIQPECCKKKKDEAEKKKKEEENKLSTSSGKVANAHVLEESSASITEVNDNFEVGLYAAT